MSELYLSASRIKTATDCSWKYWCNYHLHLPQTGNDGSRRGTICHLLFELLLKPRHKKWYDLIIKKNCIHKIPVIDRFIRYEMKREGISTEEDNKGTNNYNLIESMIVVGLKYDFFCDGKLLEEGEKEIKIETSKYKLRGFIDKLAVKNDQVYIYDYKSSAKESDHSIQAMSYALWAKRVRGMNSIANFIYLRLEDNPEAIYKFKDSELDGFEKYLEYIYDYLVNFTEKEAVSDFAADKPMPKKGEFSGPLSCGYGKYKGHCNKSGKEYWVCDYKWSYEYFALYDTTGKILKTAFKREELHPKDGEAIVKMFYEGCPKFNSKNEDFN